MPDSIEEYMRACGSDSLLWLSAIMVVIDTVFGVLRAIKEKSFNSSVGIDGAIRKGGMLISLFFFKIVDMMIKVDLIGFLPTEIRSYLGSPIGITDFFALLYIAYEVVSVLKNMALCGLPVRGVWNLVKKFLSKYTQEMPLGDLDEKDKLPLITAEDLPADFKADAEGGIDDE